MKEAPAVHLSSREIISGSPEQTFNFGFQIGECLNGGEILLLSGRWALTKKMLPARRLLWSILMKDVFASITSISTGSMKESLLLMRWISTNCSLMKPV